MYWYYRSTQWVFNGVTETWVKCSQNKTGVNINPLFDLFNKEYISISDQSYYPLSTFSGSKLFDYKRSTAIIDPVLKFGVTYDSLAIIGDMIFENKYENDKFSYLLINSKFANTDNINNYNSIRIDPNTLFKQIYNPWQISYSAYELYQNLKFVGTKKITIGSKLLKKQKYSKPVLKIYVDDIQLFTNEFTYYEQEQLTIIEINENITITSDSEILVKALLENSVTCSLVRGIICSSCSDENKVN